MPNRLPPATPTTASAAVPSPPPPRPATRRYRDQYRREIMPRRYSGPRHIALVAVVGSSAVAYALWTAAAEMRWTDLWIVPVTLLIACVVEYLAHRWPMHHPTPGLTPLFERHTRRHHRYFTTTDMHFESARDFHAVLFPPALLLFFGGIATALSAAVGLLFSLPVAALFAATAIGYYLAYEVLHFLYHVPPHWVAGRLPVVSVLARLHRRHHDPARMLECNFNLVFPLCDWLFGTLDLGRTDPQQDTPPAALLGDETPGQQVK